MKIFLLILLVLSLSSLSSCSDKDEFYSTTAFNDTFTNGLFIAKLTHNNIPYQFDYYMGKEYLLVHANFKEDVQKLRQDSLKESKSLSLINLDNQCSQQKLSKRFDESKIYHMTVTKRDIPMIRLSTKAHNTELVSTILSDYSWRC